MVCVRSYKHVDQIKLPTYFAVISAQRSGTPSWITKDTNSIYQSDPTRICSSEWGLYS